MPRLARVRARPGALRPGPADGRMYVVDALDKAPYRDFDGEYVWYPPYPRARPRHDPVRPGPDGEFDHLEPGTRAFSAAAAFAAVRCTFEIWEHYVGRRLRLVTRRGQRRLEIVPRVRQLGDGRGRARASSSSASRTAIPASPTARTLTWSRTSAGTSSSNA
jgi:hypothetical protein